MSATKEKAMSGAVRSPLAIQQMEIAKEKIRKQQEMGKKQQKDTKTKKTSCGDDKTPNPSKKSKTSSGGSPKLHRNQKGTEKGKGFKGNDNVETVIYFKQIEHSKPIPSYSIIIYF